MEQIARFPRVTGMKGDGNDGDMVEKTNMKLLLLVLLNLMAG
jgi:hypothetical protein